jgi:hypothetical protein
MRYFRLRRREAAPWLNRSRPQVEFLESRDLLSVSVGLAQSGIASTGFVPPDTIGAAGPNHFVEAVNLTMTIYNKSGTLVRSQTFASFFSSLPGRLANQSDPFVTYDTYLNKWVVGVIDYSGSASGLEFAQSNTNDPTGAWTLRRYDMTHDSTTGSYLDDFPRFGYNADAYVVTFNMFPNPSGSAHVDSLSINKSTLAGFVHAFPTTQVAIPGMSPAVIHDGAAGGPMWFVGAGSGTNIKVIKMTNELSASPTVTPYTVTVPSYSSVGTTYHQPGGTMSIQSDWRIINAAMRGGMLVAAHTVGVTGGFHQARWYEVNTTGATPTLAQSGSVGAASTDCYYPSIEINSAGALGMTYIQSSSSEFMSMYVTGRTTSDPSGTMETGMSPTGIHGTSNINTGGRGGDYSGTSVDPSDNTTFWSANEFKGSSSWNTGIARYSLGGSVGAATHYNVTAVTSTVAGNPFSVTVSALDGSGSVATGYRGTVTFSSDDPQGATLPNDYTFTAADAGVHTFTNAAALYTAGSRTITATDTVDASITGNARVAVSAAPAAFFGITSTADASGTVAGNTFDITVRAYDAYGNPATGYRGTITFSSGDPYGASLPNNYTFNALDSGTHIFRGVTALYTAGNYWDVTATDTVSGIAGSDYVYVFAAPASWFYVAAPASASSGVAFDVTVYAVDSYGNIDTNYGGTVTWTTTDTGAGVVLPADYAFQPSDQGVFTYAASAGNGVTLATPGDQFITATDTVSGITGSADVLVTSPAPRAGRGHGNAALATALPKNASALPVPAMSAVQTLALPDIAAAVREGEEPVWRVVPAGDDHGLLGHARAELLDTATLDLVLAGWYGQTRAEAVAPI